MKFRVVITGNALGFVPVRVTPIDVSVPQRLQSYVSEFVTIVRPTTLKFFGFSGSIGLEIKSV